MNEPSPRVHSFRTSRRVEFADTDMGRIVHFSRFFVFMETAEHEFLASVGLPLHQEFGGGEVGWPRVDAWCTYLSPARYGDQLEIRLLVEKMGRSAMTYAFSFHLDEVQIARGRLTSVCCRFDDERMKSTPIPEPMASTVGSAPSEELTALGF